jgi:hypothetical protein
MVSLGGLTTNRYIGEEWLVLGDLPTNRYISILALPSTAQSAIPVLINKRFQQLLLNDLSTAQSTIQTLLRVIEH